MSGVGVDWEQRVDWQELRAARVEKMRRAMDDAGLDGLLVQRHDNVRYLTSMRGFTSMIYQPRYAAFLGAGSARPLTLLSEAGDLAIARERMPWLDRIETWSYSLDENIDSISRLIHEQGLEGETIGVDDVTSPVVILALQKRFPYLKFVDGSQAIAVAKSIKHPQEISLLRMAAEVAEVGMAAAQAAIGIGVRENVIAGEMLRAMTEAGADAIVSYPQCTIDALRRMGTDQRLRAHQVVLIDINIGVNGYVGDFARTFAVSKPTDDQRRAFEAQKACMKAAVAAIRPGVLTTDIQDIVAAIARDAGLEEHWAGYITGHGVGTGLGPWEQPIIGTARGSINELQEGMTLCLEPGFFHPAIGPVRNEDMIVVTANGAEVLTTYPYHDAFSQASS